jgi:hypothetical protein
MSRYHQLYDSTGTAKFTTLQTSTSSNRSGAITSRRITIIGNGTAHFVAFGTSTVTASTSSCVLPASAVLDFNFTSGQYVAALAASGTGYISIIDSD